MNQRPFSQRFICLLLALCLLSIRLGLMFWSAPVVRARTMSNDNLGVGSLASEIGSALPNTTHTVVNTNDSGPGSLRDAISSAISGDVIDFSLTYPATITLSSSLVIAKNLTINGPGAINLTISGNSAVRVLRLNIGAKVNLSGVTIANGKAARDMGGGIYNSGTLTITASTFSANSAEGDGGGIYNGGFGTLNISGSTFVGNNAGSLLPAASGSGGGISNDGVAVVRNSTFAGNTALDGGGAIANWLSLQIVNSTLSGNGSSHGPGGGLYNTGGAAMRNTIVANNIATPGGNCYGTIGSLGYNLEFGNSCILAATGDIINTNPSLAPLAYYGGPTKTMALFFGSPALDRIPNGTSGCGTSVTTDQRGAARPQGSGCDIGAYEYDGSFIPLFLPLIAK